MKKLLFSLLISNLLFHSSFAQFTITTGGGPSAIINAIGGPGLTISNVTINCAAVSYGTYNNANLGGLGGAMTNGLVLSTGTATQINGPGTNANDDFTGICVGSSSNDPQLVSVIGAGTAINDACIIEFDVVPQCNSLSIRFVFGSDEYTNWVSQGFNDGFGFWVTGPNPGGGNYTNFNMATLPSGTTVSIDNVNNTTNAAFFVNNNAGGSANHFDGFTTVLTPSIAVTACQTYHFKLAIADASDCAMDSGVLVDIIQCVSPWTATTSSTPASCGVSDGVATVNASGGIGPFTYSWSPTGGTAATANGLAPGSYTVTVNDGLTCTPAQTYTVTVASSSLGPNISVGPTQAITCITSSVTLSGNSTTPNVTYSWTGPGGFASSSQNPTVSVSGTYTLTVTDPLAPACPSVATQIVNLNNTPPDASAGATQQLSCTSPTANLLAISTVLGVTYNWSGPGGFSSTLENPTASTAGTYTVIITDPTNGCTATAQQTVIGGVGLPNVSVGTTQTLTCLVNSVNLTGNSTNASVTYSWSGPGGFSSTLTNPSVTAVGTYTLTVTDTNGCANTAQQIVTSNTTTPDVSVGTVQTIPCNGNPVSLNGNSTTTGATYSWDGPSGFSSTSQNPSVNVVGTYTLTVTDPSNGCTDTAQQVVISNTAVPTITTGIAQTLTCVTTSVSLSGNSTTAGVTYLWAGPNGFTSTSQNPSVTASGTYSLTVTDPNTGCVNNATQLVNSDTQAPNANAGLDGILPCSGNSISLSGIGSSSGTNFTYNWTTTSGNIVSNGTTLTPSVNALGAYVLTVTNTTNGCTSTDTVIVNPDVFPNVSFVATPSSGQAPLVVDFINNTTNATTYSWNFGNTETSSLTNPSTTYTNSGSYTVTLIATNSNGCIDSMSIIVLVVDPIQPSVLVIPNVFTPNGDGNNDNFSPVMAEGLVSFKATVYDRWGLKMYEWTNSQSQGWNGNAKNGSPAPDGTYYYIVEGKGLDNKEYNTTGYIQLIRR